MYISTTLWRKIASPIGGKVSQPRRNYQAQELLVAFRSVSVVVSVLTEEAGPI